jgi:hypothetical protein
VVTVVLVVAALTFVNAAHPAPAAELWGIGTIAAADGATSGKSPLFPAEKRPVPPQYHGRTQPVSPDIIRSIGRRTCCQIASPISYQTAAAARSEGSEQARQAENPQYQAVSRQYQDKELMLQIGIVLGLAYLAFLAIWFWATRLRPH